jgi:hypothetical protein
MAEIISLSLAVSSIPSYPPYKFPSIVRFRILITAKEFHATPSATEPGISSASATSLTFVLRHHLGIIRYCIGGNVYLDVG